MDKHSPLRNCSLVCNVFAILCISSLQSQAQRVDNKALNAAAIRFRNSVLEFEKKVVSVRGIERSDERVVDKFEESTRRVVAASKNPRLLSRLQTEYAKTKVLQSKAFTAIFEKYTPHHDLAVAYQNVQWCQFYFEQEFAFHLANPRNRNRVERRDRVATPIPPAFPFPAQPTQLTR